MSELLCVLAGGYANNTLLTFGSLDVLDRERCLLLVPESRGSTWDMIRGGFGPDVRFIDAMMRHVFERFAVDPCRCGLAGGKRLCVTGTACSHSLSTSGRLGAPPAVAVSKDTCAAPAAACVCVQVSAMVPPTP